MDEQKVHDKLDKIIEDITDIKVVQGKQQVTLDHHVYRCDLLEEGQKMLKEELSKEIAPLKNFRERMIGAVKWTGLVLAVATVILTALKLVL